MNGVTEEDRQIADWLRQAAELLAEQGAARLERFLAGN